MIQRGKALAQIEGSNASHKKPVSKKRAHKKTLTVFNPFEFKTTKRVRLDMDQDFDQEKTPYEPLW